MHIIDALNVGGAQRLLVELAARIPPTTCRTVVCSLQAPDDCATALRDRGARVISCGRLRPSIINPVRFTAYAAGGFSAILRLCRTEHASVVHCHLSDAEFLGIAAGRCAGVPRLVTTVHYPDLLPDRPAGSLRNVLRRTATVLLYRYVHAVIAVSDEVAGRLREFVPSCADKIRVIMNGIDTAAYSAVPAPVFGDPAVVTTVARLMPPKGHRFLLDAAQRLVRGGRRITIMFAGDGDLRHSLERRCRELGIADAVQFLGNRSDIAALLGATDIFVLPSLWEGTSLALLEAMAGGRPIVATTIPGIAAVVQDGRSGLLVPPGDADALAQAISIFLDNPQFARQCGEEARAVARARFDIGTTIKALTSVWGIA